MSIGPLWSFEKRISPGLFVKASRLVRVNPDNLAFQHPSEFSPFIPEARPLLPGVDDDLGWDRQRIQIPLQGSAFERLVCPFDYGNQVKITADPGIASGIRAEIPEIQ